MPLIQKNHHGISADLMASKFGIGTDKSKHTLEYTTQEKVR